MGLFKRTLSLFIVFLLSSAIANAEMIEGGKALPSFKQDAASIRHTYETQLYTLSAFKAGHYGLRMYRQTMDPKYSAAVWSDMARVASRLNQFSSEVHTPKKIEAYSNKRLSIYVDETDIRSILRYQATKTMPEYLYFGVDLLGSMARANEYGLKHRNDKQLREIIRRYDFKKYATDEAMIKAWAAQLANQVYWLRQLGEQDVVDDFIEAFKLTYPDKKDTALSKQQYGNKIYGLTHILLADSQYYQYPLKESDHQWVYDYLRNNIDTILKRTKADIISEVGITFLLAGLEDDPVVYKTQKYIQNEINREKNMVPSTSNSTDLTEGEHRNVLAIMLLDWQTPHAAPTIQNEPKIFKSKPYGLVKK
ncbi:DUF3541 domain-containing protein [Aliivibrio sp. S3MY1]|uniref:DUF3541 domain-containing protein n=1 Tax=unclassified Aliivibrio TaxID=2645654 RepID=UPI002378A0DD|nr:MULTISPECIES: DUF3541 domain-containing protein [unclassified Aliivibrio]MDD9196178.1 DUF3541 domain-containing protein [Aliivibrio sp. S3MY1]MDD9199551.1 DUF3541 domain-containing protein [Aliivibrio sp. S2MY1]